MKAIDREENTGLADEDRHWYERPRAQHAAHGAQYAAQQANMRHTTCNTQTCGIQLATRNTRLAAVGRRFVHGMTVKASANHKMISRTLAQIKTRLDLLGRQVASRSPLGQPQSTTRGQLGRFQANTQWDSCESRLAAAVKVRTGLMGCATGTFGMTTGPNEAQVVQNARQTKSPDKLCL